MKLREGMYVRTKEGKIFDCYVSEQMEKPIYYPKSSKTNGYIDYEEVYKKSKCIIDLIEVGDYVNGYLVTFVYRPDGNEVFGIELEKNILQGHIISKSEQIKSIVTKEQFENMKYEVKKDE